MNNQTLIIPTMRDDHRILVQKCKLLAVSGPLKGQEFVIAKDAFTIGSDSENDLMLADSTISRRHCEITLSADGYTIRDLGSTNGTVVQGVRIREAMLDEGTEFQIGSTRLVFCPTADTVEFKISAETAFGSLTGHSDRMRRVFYLAERYAPTDSTILIEGETGTGKEILAEELHRHSRRAGNAFVIIDCASLAKELIASELFGHLKGAFTGALADRAGAFEHADEGTVFLDEIGDLPLDLQPQLLRVLEKREIRRLGSNQHRKINVRVIAATNKKLETEVAGGRFRDDLFYRLSVVRIEIPPLRRRTEDIGPLLEKFLTEFMGPDPYPQIKDLGRAMRILKSQAWPGNVRELRNLAEVVACSEQRPIELTAFLTGRRIPGKFEELPSRYTADRPYKVVKNELLAAFENRYLTELMKRHDGNISQAARDAGIERAYLQRLIRKHNIGG